MEKQNVSKYFKKSYFQKCWRFENFHKYRSRCVTNRKKWKNKIFLYKYLKKRYFQKCWRLENLHKYRSRCVTDRKNGKTKIIYPSIKNNF